MMVTMMVDSGCARGGLDGDCGRGRDGDGGRDKHHERIHVRIYTGVLTYMHHMRNHASTRAQRGLRERAR